eukprot:4550859-Amphidinium_carterae.1
MFPPAADLSVLTYPWCPAESLVELDHWFTLRYSRPATYDGTAAKFDAIALRNAVPEKYRASCTGQEAIAAFATAVGGSRISGSTLAREMAVRSFNADHERMLRNLDSDGAFATGIANLWEVLSELNPRHTLLKSSGMRRLKETAAPTIDPAAHVAE